MLRRSSNICRNGHDKNVVGTREFTKRGKVYRTCAKCHKETAEKHSRLDKEERARGLGRIDKGLRPDAKAPKDVVPLTDAEIEAVLSDVPCLGCGKTPSRYTVIRGRRVRLSAPVTEHAPGCGVARIKESVVGRPRKGTAA